MLRSRLAHQEAFQEQDARKTHCKDRNQVSNIKTVHAILIHRAFIVFGQRYESKEDNPSSERMAPRLSGITVRMRGFGFADVKKIVICLPMKHLRVLKTHLNVFVLSRLNWSLKCWFLRRGKNLPEQRKEPTNIISEI